MQKLNRFFMSEAYGWFEAVVSRDALSMDCIVACTVREKVKRMTYDTAMLVVLTGC
jgi:hypothetical protein